MYKGCVKFYLKNTLKLKSNLLYLTKIMFRNNYLNGVVLKTFEVGEMHKGIMILTPQNGIISAIAHGAKKVKNRFRSSTEQFCLSKFYLYYNPVRKDYKITDIESLKVFNRIRESLAKYYTASLWIEIILRSFAGGENTSLIYNLLCEALKYLNDSIEDKVPYISIQFIWRFICISGYNPSLEICGTCGRLLEPAERIKFSGNSFNCMSCSGENGQALLPGARMYLINTSRKSIAESLKISMDNESVNGLKNILYLLIQAILETELNSLKCSEGRI
jgi:DNA repair protein RecO (recombination protein O)